MKFPWLGRVRSFFCGNLVLRNGDEIGLLESAVSGPVLFDAVSQKVSVGNMAVSQAEDNYACADGLVTGFPAYGVTPEGRYMGQNPDRDIAFVRPPDSNTGTLYGHLVSCSPGPGLKPEVSPVQIIPAGLPDPAPAGLFNLAFAEVDSEGCAPKTRRWYAVPPQDSSAVDANKLPLYNLPDDFVPPGDTTAGLAVWVLNEEETKWQLRKISHESLLRLIGVQQSQNMVKFVRPRPVIFTGQWLSGAGFTNLNQNYNLALAPNYTTEMTGVVLTVDTYGYAGTRKFDLTFSVDDEVFAKMGFGVTNGQAHVTNTFFVPIPASKQINLKFTETTYVGGTYDDMGINVYLDGFMK